MSSALGQIACVQSTVGLAETAEWFAVILDHVPGTS